MLCHHYCDTISTMKAVMFFIMHLGLSPDLNDFDQIRSIARPTDVPDTGLLCDLLWSDPDKDMQGWGENDRGVSFTFGSDIVTKFLNRHDLDLICRAHQVRRERERERERQTDRDREMLSSDDILSSRLLKMAMSFLLVVNL